MKWDATLYDEAKAPQAESVPGRHSGGFDWITFSKFLPSGDGSR